MLFFTEKPQAVQQERIRQEEIEASYEDEVIKTGCSVGMGGVKPK